MRKVAVVTDSAANLPADLIERHHILVAPTLLYVDGREYRDGIDITATELYQRMRRSTDDGWIPRTSTPSMGEFLRVYTIAAQEAEEIVSIHTSAKISGIYQVACTAGELVNIPVHPLDSRVSTVGLGFAVLEAARLAETGADAQAVIQRATEIAASTRVLFVLARFDYLHRGGHVPAIAAIAGTALKIQPILTFEDGVVQVAAVPRTRRRAVERMLRSFEKDATGRPVHVAVMHADALSEAEQLRDQIDDRFQCVESFITEFTPVMGAHTGPGLVGVAYHVESECAEA